MMDAEAVVFVVDDDASLHASLQDLLESVGLRVAACASANPPKPPPTMTTCGNAFVAMVSSFKVCLSCPYTHALKPVMPLPTAAGQEEWRHRAGDIVRRQRGRQQPDMHGPSLWWSLLHKALRRQAPVILTTC